MSSAHLITSTKDRKINIQNTMTETDSKGLQWMDLPGSEDKITLLNVNE